MAAGQLLVQPLLPVLAGPDTGFLVEVEKDLFEPEPAELRTNAVGHRMIEAGMADEDRWHGGLQAPWASGARE
jgi:hypothetical protein